MPIAMQYGSGNYTAQNMPQSGGGGSSGGIEIKLLWTNPSPNAAFAAQTVSLDLSGYDAVGIIAKLSYSATSQHTTMQIFPVDEDTVYALYIFSYASANGGRNTIVKTTGVEFQVGNYNNATSNNYCIPYQIYGIKGIT